MNVQLLECHGPGVSLASTNETYCRVHAAVVLHEPPFTNYSMEAGTETGEEASEPKGIDGNRRIGGSLGDSWIRCVR